MRIPKKTAVSIVFLSLVAVMGLSGAGPATPQAAPDPQVMLRIAKDIQKAIVTLPNYGVFDDLHFAMQDDHAPAG